MFDEAVQAATGDVVIKTVGGGSTETLTIPIGDEQIQFVDNIMTVNPTVDLPHTGGKAVTVTIAHSAITDGVSASPGANRP